jgi:hypothetical protein
MKIEKQHIGGLKEISLLWALQFIFKNSLLQQS